MFRQRDVVQDVVQDTVLIARGNSDLSFMGVFDMYHFSGELLATFFCVSTFWRGWGVRREFLHFRDCCVCLGGFAGLGAYCFFAPGVSIVRAGNVFVLILFLSRFRVGMDALGYVYFDILLHFPGLRHIEQTYICLSLCSAHVVKLQ